MINILRLLFESAQLVLFCRNFDLRYSSAAQKTECSVYTAVFFQNPLPQRYCHAMPKA